MNSDQKIGVALLIGLTGFAIALGFGRKAAPMPVDDPAVPLAAAGDAFSTPIVGMESPTDPFAVDATDAAESAPLADAIEPPGTPSRPSFGPVEMSDPSDAIAPATVSGWTLPPPDRPNRALDARRDASPADALEPTASPAETAASVVTQKPQPPAFREYVVKPGDTLSGIAARETGSVGRYYELFKANEDRLSHPNALQIGQSLRIPVELTQEPATRTY